MDEILNLQKQLAAVQQASALQRLSERNCVEIVSKLIESGKLKVLFTTNGKEYLTPEQLEREIKDELLVHGGRINLVDIPPLLNVGLEHIEGKAEEIARKEGVTLLNGELLTSYYLDSVAEEINEALQESGQLQLSDLTVRFNLPSDFMRDLIQQRIGTFIFGKLKNATLFTQAYVQRHLARVRGLFNSVTKATVVSQLVQQYKLDESLFYAMLDELIRDEKLAGKLQGPTFTPALFLATQESVVDSFYSQNGYVEYERLKKVQIANPKQYLANRYKDGLTLESCFLHRKLIAHLDATVEETVRDESWLDCSEILPSPLSPSDVAAVVKECAVMKKTKPQAVQLCQVHVVSVGFLNKCIQMFEAKAAEAAQNEFLRKTSATVEPLEEIEGKGSKKNTKKSNVPKEEPAAKRKSKPSKGKGRGRQADSSDDDMAGETVQEGTVSISLTELAKHLSKEFQHLDQELIQEIAERIRGAVSELYAKSRATVFSSTATLRRQKQEQFSSQFDSLSQELLLLQRGTAWFESEGLGPLNAFLCKTICSDLLNLLLENQAFHQFIELSDLLRTDSNEEPRIKTSADRRKVLERLPPDVNRVLNRLSETLSRKNAAEFVTVLEEAAFECGLRVRKMDKKQERQNSLGRREALRDQLRIESDPNRVLQLSLLLAVQEVCNVCVTVPCEMWACSLLWDRLRQNGEMPETAAKSMGNFFESVQKWQRTKQTSEEQSVDLELSKAVEAEMIQVRELAVTGLKGRRANVNDGESP
eukprot:GILK01008197.1.p1 GENE.GILK01008197.1~~GILK01008197.1.p1  ORF type:complete len:783 (+),score=202.83 GILK01008197.1:68-2350(+)